MIAKIYRDPLFGLKIAPLSLSYFLILRWLLVGMHTLAALEHSFRSLLLDAVILLFFVFLFVVETLASLHVFFASDGLLGWIVVDVGSKRNRLLQYHLIWGERLETNRKSVDLISFHPFLLPRLPDLAIRITLSILAAVFLLSDLLEWIVKMLKLILFVAQLVVESTGHLELLLLVGLDWSGFFCVH